MDLKKESRALLSGYVQRYLTKILMQSKSVFLSTDLLAEGRSSHTTKKLSSLGKNFFFNFYEKGCSVGGYRTSPVCFVRQPLLKSSGKFQRSWVNYTLQRKQKYFGKKDSFFLFPFFFIASVYKRNYGSFETTLDSRQKARARLCFASARQHLHSLLTAVKREKKETKRLVRGRSFTRNTKIFNLNSLMLTSNYAYESKGHRVREHSRLALGFSPRLQSAKFTLRKELGYLGALGQGASNFFSLRRPFSKWVISFPTNLKRLSFQQSNTSILKKTSPFFFKEKTPKQKQKIVIALLNLYIFFGKRITYRSKMSSILQKPKTYEDLYQTYIIFKDFYTLYYIFYFYLRNTKNKPYQGSKKHPFISHACGFPFYFYLKQQNIHKLTLTINSNSTSRKKRYYLLNIKPFVRQKRSLTPHFYFSFSYKLMRPLFSITRLDTCYICHCLKLPIYPDKSNLQIMFLRNRIRKQILPAIRILLNPQFETIICNFNESFFYKPL